MQNLLFLNAGIFLDTYFSNSILRFLAGVHLSRPIDGVKRAGCIFDLKKKGREHFLLLRKGQGGGTL